MQRDLDCLEEEEARGAAACEDGELTHGSDTQTAQPKLLSEGTIVLIKENARNKAGRGAKFLGEQAVVVGNASGMGGWHFLVRLVPQVQAKMWLVTTAFGYALSLSVLQTCSDGTLLKLQRNALEVVELVSSRPRPRMMLTSTMVRTALLTVVCQFQPTDTPRTFPACTSEAVERQHRHKRADPGKSSTRRTRNLLLLKVS